ncbi:ABC transporter permease subunit [Paenibacillus sp. LHD-117]|uniref:ABC transporter permease subunit n=1 Tax=Paenibacillus sp. LHD-117 TaxID=3071412 RepID=UPI0027E06AE2|nr:ABC transporter permease subunit [Paenibacillus sp. LHD-117]MDQ6422550.1 ABC transporter permease subunit [Paenibacillus sp. LHD-117]
MSKAAQTTIMVPGMILFVLLLAALPLVIQTDFEGGPIRIAWSQGVQAIQHYFAGIGDGETFRFYVGKNEYTFWERIGDYFRTSFLYVTAGALIGTTIGIFVGIYFTVSKAGWLKSIVDLVGSLPDFVVVLILQFVIVLIAKESGVVLFQVATLTYDDPAIVLPLISMIIIPANYMIRSVAMQMKLTLTEDYIGNAKARGLGKAYIIFFHALPNVLPFVKGDVHKLMGIIMGNLFIVEYLFNNNGITMLIFSNAFDHGYQYNIVVNGLLAFLVLYAIGYGLLRAFLFGLGKVFLR